MAFAIVAAIPSRRATRTRRRVMPAWPEPVPGQWSHESYHCLQALPGHEYYLDQSKGAAPAICCDAHPVRVGAFFSANLPLSTLSVGKSTLLQLPAAAAAALLTYFSSTDRIRRGLSRSSDDPERPAARRHQQLGSSDGETCDSDRLAAARTTRNGGKMRHRAGPRRRTRSETQLSRSHGIGVDEPERTESAAICPAGSGSAISWPRSRQRRLVDAESASSAAADWRLHCSATAAAGLERPSRDGPGVIGTGGPESVRYGRKC